MFDDILWQTDLCSALLSCLTFPQHLCDALCSSRNPRFTQILELAPSYFGSYDACLSPCLACTLPASLAGVTASQLSSGSLPD